MADRVGESSEQRMPSPEPVSEADRWNARYRGLAVPESIEPPALLAQIAATVTPGLRVLDLACGLGDAGLFLAQLGARSTCADISPVALDLVCSRADDHGLTVETIVVDLASDPVPTGPWDLICCAHYLDRPLLTALGRELAPGGRAAITIATRTNLDRHKRPSERFLLDPGELPTLTPDLAVVHHDEGWRSNGVHEAWLIAQKP